MEWLPHKRWNPFNSNKLLAHVYRWRLICRGRSLPPPPLKDLFPDLPWEEDWPRAQAQAAQQLGDLFSRYGDQDRAREWLTESRELAPGAASTEQYAAGL